ncbi:hypothetical protein BDM02DRAFT_3086480 [Thelephora ganbajun]|uniref:Uncharacterized protein n=1 Tax=Thelephora ganbajun TaxID=370292 RepID=A0ACB6ZWF6_THEGA|nr:hypothetical protein BDM02DRAFT_3086480 [Thelephora ganbajun]
MHAIKTPSFFRPSSRPTSPAQPPTPAAKLEMASNPLSKFALASFKRLSPTPAVDTPQATTPLVQDGSYLEVLGLKLSEAVTRALAQPTGPALPHEQLGGRRPIPAGRGHALGAFISGEIRASQDNPHLQRAIIRSLQRPLSVLLSNISAHLLPLFSSPQFLATTLTQQQSCLNATQLHAVGLATLAGEILETFGELGLGHEVDGRPDGLKVIREGLLSLVTRVVNPLIASVQSELLPLIDALEKPSPVGRTGSGLNSKSVKTFAPHPSITGLYAVVPLYAKGLAKIAAVDAAQSSLGAMLITLVWHGLVALAHRPLTSGSPPASPKLASAIAKPKTKPSTTPPTSPSPRFMAILPPSPPSTPPNHQAGSSLPGDARVLSDVLGLIAKPSKDKAAGPLASEAVDEAFTALGSLISLLDLIYKSHSQTTPNFEQLEADLIAVTDDLPTLIGLPILLHAYVTSGDSQEGEELPSVASILGMTDEAYRANCLAGFKRADECEEAVGKHMIHVLRNNSTALGAAMVANWLERQVRHVR